VEHRHPNDHQGANQYRGAEDHSGPGHSDSAAAHGRSRYAAAHGDREAITNGLIEIPFPMIIGNGILFFPL
jgi:hypothetical protein